jgi:two-component system response regulator YesN
MRTKQTLFFRLLTTYLPILYVVIFVLIFVFFMTVNQLSQRQTVKANEAFSHYTLQRLDSLLANIDQIVNAEITNNKELNSYVYLKNDVELNPYLLSSKVSDRFRQIKLSFPLIYSIYLYRNIDMNVLSSDMLLPLDRFGDRMFLQELLNQSFTSTWTPVRKYKDFDMQAYDVRIVSLVKKVPDPSNPYGVLVVNLDVASLQTWLNELTAGSISYVKLFDNQGNLLGTSKNAANSDILTLTSEVTGWKMSSGLLANYHYGIFTDVYEGWIILGVIMIVIASAGMVYLSKRYAKPIDSSMNRISEFISGKQLGQSKGEVLQYVDLAVDQIIDFAKRYQSESNTNLPYRQKHFFQELLAGDRVFEVNELHEEMRYFGFTEKWTSFGVALIEIDRISDFAQEYSYRDQYLLKFVLMNVLKEIIEQQQMGVWCDWLSSETLGVLFGHKESLILADTVSTCSSIQQWVQANLDFTVTIGVGSVVTLSEHIRISFDQADKALQYKSALGNNRVIDYTSTSRRSESEIFEVLQLIRSIVQAYKCGNEDWIKQFDFLFGAIGRGIYAHDEMINLFHYMSYTFTRELSDFPPEYTEIWKQEAMAPMTLALSTFETLDELRCVYLNSLTHVAEKWRLARDHKGQRSQMRDVRDYIEQHYNDSTLSLQLLSDRFGLSKNYLSRLFKDEIGANFIDYLTNIRMRHARQMLEESGIPIQEIAVKVGYEHYFTFNRAFKKITGFPPNEFRKQQEA